MLRKAIFAPFFLLLLAFFAIRGQAYAYSQDKVYTANRFDVAAQITSDNTLHVTETEVFHFSGGTFSFVIRELPTDNTDGINIISTSMDQQDMSQGTATGQYEVDYSNPVKITWHFLVQPKSTHTFTLTYEIKGIVQKHPQQDLIDWKPLPLQHSYPISSSTISISYPQNASLVQTPEVDQGSASVSTSPGQAVYHASNLGADQALELGLRFRPGLVSNEPRWQLFPELSIKLLPFMIPLGLLIAVFGSWIPLRYYRRYRRPSPNALQLAGLGVTTPPGDLAPAIAGVLATTDNANPGWNQVLATLFSLMDRGIIAIAPPSMGGWIVGNTDFNFVLARLDADVRPHEAVLLSILFQSSAGNVAPLVGIKRAGERYRSKAQEFTKALLGEMTVMGMIDSRRQGIRHRLGCIAGFISVMAIIVGALLIFIAPWPLVFIPIGFLVVGIVISSTGSLVSIYTEAAHEAALPWKAFAEYMRLLTVGQGVLGAELFASYLAYATSFDLLTDWASSMQNYGLLALPGWFRELVTAGYIQNQAMAWSEFHRMSESAREAGEPPKDTSSTGGSGGSNMSGSSGASGGGSSSAG